MPVPDPLLPLLKVKLNELPDGITTFSYTVTFQDPSNFLLILLSLEQDVKPIVKAAIKTKNRFFISSDFVQI